MLSRSLNCSLVATTGVDGCFIKLTTGAQILAATGRDGNNNIFPLAFAVVGQEDTANWCWFLHQLKICLGGEVGKFGPYTIMSDRQKVCMHLSVMLLLFCSSALACYVLDVTVLQLRLACYVNRGY